MQKLHKIILASASPRRKQLLEQIGLEFTVDPSSQEENIPYGGDPEKHAQQLSLEKADEVAKRYTDAIIIGADTIVVFQNQVLGKPKTKEDAQKMLTLLSGNKHTVITGFTIINTRTKETVTKSVSTHVYMKKLTQKEIDVYIDSGEPFDKAGAYGIQERGAVFIERIEGDFFNVVGLPVATVFEELKHLETTSTSKNK